MACTGTGCVSCVHCENCNSTNCASCNASCNGTCNGCNICVACQTVCQYKQLLKDHAGKFEFKPKPATNIQIGPNTGMFTRDSWNAAAKWISKRADVPSGDSVAHTGGSTVSNYTGTLFTYDEFNRISGIVGGPTVEQYQLIKADLFTTLETNLNNLKVSADACTANNTCKGTCQTGTCQTCNVACQTCQTCVHCEHCNSSVCGGCTSCNDCVTGENNTPTTQ